MIPKKNNLLKKEVSDAIRHKSEHEKIQIYKNLINQSNAEDALKFLLENITSYEEDEIINTFILASFRLMKFDIMTKVYSKYMDTIENKKFSKHRRDYVYRNLMNICMLSLYRDDINDCYRDEIHRRVGRIIDQSMVKLPLQKPHSHKKVRIGLVSNQINNHAVGKFTIPFLLSLDYSKYDVFIYFNEMSTQSFQYDEMISALSSVPVKYRTVRRDQLVSAAKAIRFDEIDVLLDLAGCAAGNMLPMFACRPAKIQASWIGYPHHPGLDSIDYFLSDKFCSSFEKLTIFTERENIYIFDRFFSCYQGDLSATIVPRDDRESSVIRFGSFNNIMKISAKTVSLWSDVLKECDNSTISLKFYKADNYQIENIKGLFLKNGISSDRVIFMNRTEEKKDHLLMYNNIDIALDTFPYNGTTTSCEALWMGVPVITIDGTGHHSRVTSGILREICAADLIAKDNVGFVSLAKALYQDNARLSYYRNTLRDMILNSKICDSEDMARNFDLFVDFAMRRLQL